MRLEEFILMYVLECSDRRAGGEREPREEEEERGRLLS